MNYGLGLCFPSPIAPNGLTTWTNSRIPDKCLEGPLVPTCSSDFYQHKTGTANVNPALDAAVWQRVG